MDDGHENGLWAGQSEPETNKTWKSTFETPYWKVVTWRLYTINKCATFEIIKDSKSLLIANK